MKNIVILFLFIPALFFVACSKEEINLGIPESSIYFDRNALNTVENFANYLDSESDLFIELKVNATGEKSASDRKFSVLIADSSTAVVGRDIEIIDSSLVIRKGELTGNLQIRLIKSENIADEGLKAYLRLEPGSEFSGTLIDTDRQAIITVFDRVSQPIYWDWFAYGYFDEYSEKKYRLIQELTGMDDEILNTEPDSEESFMLLIGLLKRWGIIFKRHLDQENANGTPVLEEDGSPMMYGEYLD